jgi:DNA-directed RNA polymerase subunit N (RpoN/RPB10)
MFLCFLGFTELFIVPNSILKKHSLSLSIILSAMNLGSFSTTAAATSSSSSSTSAPSTFLYIPSDKSKSKSKSQQPQPQQSTAVGEDPTTRPDKKTNEEMWYDMERSNHQNCWKRMRFLYVPGKVRNRQRMPDLSPGNQRIESLFQYEMPTDHPVLKNANINSSRSHAFLRKIHEFARETKQKRRHQRHSSTKGVPVDQAASPAANVDSVDFAKYVKNITSRHTRSGDDHGDDDDEDAESDDDDDNDEDDNETEPERDIFTRAPGHHDSINTSSNDDVRAFHASCDQQPEATVYFFNSCSVCVVRIRDFMVRNYPTLMPYAIRTYENGNSFDSSNNDHLISTAEMQDVRLMSVPYRCADIFALDHPMDGNTKTFSSQNSVTMTIDAEAPANAPLSVCASLLNNQEFVDSERSHDAKSASMSTLQKTTTKTPLVTCPIQFPLTVLPPEQKLKIKVTLGPAYGTQHMCASPIVLLGPIPIREVTIKKGAIRGPSAHALCKSVCAQRVFDIEDGAAIVRNGSRCNECGRCQAPSFAHRNDISVRIKTTPSDGHAVLALNLISIGRVDDLRLLLDYAMVLLVNIGHLNGSDYQRPTEWQVPEWIDESLDKMLPSWTAAHDEKNQFHARDDNGAVAATTTTPSEAVVAATTNKTRDETEDVVMMDGPRIPKNPSSRSSSSSSSSSSLTTQLQQTKQTEMGIQTEFQQHIQQTKWDGKTPELSTSMLEYLQKLSDLSRRRLYKVWGIFPIRCFVACGQVISHYYYEFERLTKIHGLSNDMAFWSMDLERPCCRAMILTYINQIPRILQARKIKRLAQLAPDSSSSSSSTSSSMSALLSCMSVFDVPSSV